MITVIPARNEQALLADCLAAVADAVANCTIPARTIVVLDSCADASVDICSRHRVETVEVGFANVGQARHAGVERALRLPIPFQSTWIANTDADSRVPPDWLSEQIRLANDGADVVLGVVTLADEGQASVHQAHQSAYAHRVRPDGTHRHIHGANLGIRASTYLESGGFPPLTDHEDRELIRRARALGRALVVTSTGLRVQTSGRTEGRCHDGFARFIANMPHL